MTREQTYTAQMTKAGIYDPAFDPEIRMLCTMEREHQRTHKAWKAEGSPTDSKLYDVLERQRRDILNHREALGLTPRAMKRMKGIGWANEQEPENDAPKTMLELIMEKKRAAG